MTILARLIGVGLLAACNTVHGMGEDVKSGGAAIADTAKNVQSTL